MLGKYLGITTTRVTDKSEVKLGQEFVPATRFFNSLNTSGHANSSFLTYASFPSQICSGEKKITFGNLSSHLNTSSQKWWSKCRKKETPLVGVTSPTPDASKELERPEINTIEHELTETVDGHFTVSITGTRNKTSRW